MDNNNIGNLQALWRQFGLSNNAFYKNEALEAVIIPGTEYPNRVWATKELSTSTLRKIREFLQMNRKATFSLFCQSAATLIPLEAYGLELQSTQFGMSLPLNRTFSESDRLVFQQVLSDAEILNWCETFEQSFSYRINQDSLRATLPHLYCFLIKYGEEVVGTILLYPNDQVAGIHSLGIIPAWRGKGIAREAMYLILNYARKKGAKQAVLQASGMAKHLYERIGFSHDFLMINTKLIPSWNL